MENLKILKIAFALNPKPFLKSYSHDIDYLQNAIFKNIIHQKIWNKIEFF